MKKFFIFLFVFIVSISLFIGVFADSGGVSMTLAEWVELIFDTLVDTFTYFTDLGPDGFISDIWDSLKKGFSDIVDNITSLGTTIRTKLNSLITWMSDLNVTISNFFRSIVTWLEDINDSLVTKLRSVVDWLRDINSTIVTKFTTLGDKIVNLGPTINSKVQALIDKIQNLFSSDKNVNSSIVDDTIQKEDALNNSISSDLESSSFYYNIAYSILISLGSAMSAVTMIFNKFVNIPFFGSLIYVSISVGIVSALLGLAGLVGKVKG